MRKCTYKYLFIWLTAFAFISCGSSSGGTTPTIEGLLLHFTFNQDSGTTVTDSSGNGNDGTLVGGTWTEGRSGNAISFDGVDDSIQIPGPGENPPESISGLSEGTIAVWFKYDAELDDDGIILPIFYLGPSVDVTDTLEGLIIEVGHQGIWADNTELFYTVTLAEALEPILCFDSGSNLTANEWYHFAVVVSSAGNTGYLNGSEMTDREYNFDDSSGTEFLNSVTAGILSLGYGRFAVDGQFHYFKGLIDDFRIYSRALNADEILQVYEDIQ